MDLKQSFISLNTKLHISSSLKFAVFLLCLGGWGVLSRIEFNNPCSVAAMLLKMLPEMLIVFPSLEVRS